MSQIIGQVSVIFQGLTSSKSLMKNDVIASNFFLLYFGANCSPKISYSCTINFNIVLIVSQKRLMSISGKKKSIRSTFFC